MKNIVLIVGLVLSLVFSGCGMVGINGLSTEDTASLGFCIEGSGPPMTGGGLITGAKTNKDFKGSVTVGADCSINITSE